MFYEPTADKRESSPEKLLERIKTLPMRKFRRNQMFFKCIKVEEKIPVQDTSHLVKWTRPGDWICWPIGEDGQLLKPHVTSGATFRHDFIEIEEEKIVVERQEENAFEMTLEPKLKRKKKD